MQPRSVTLGLAATLFLAGMLPLAGSAEEKKPPTEPPRDLARYDASIQPSDRQHWAYQPVKKPAIPRVKNTAWVLNPIDSFILAKLEAANWQPSPPAEPHALLRRLYLDLTGLPPTLGEQEAFRKNPTPSALDRIIDHLLSRPSHGERWARHWLDLVRYAETNGYERDASKPFVWRYRDYVIRAFNEDKPYDRFILEQLAGDELPDADADTLVALGYNRLGPWDDEPADPLEDRYDQLDDLVTTTSLVFLGMTLSCARCHDHKFEAITMHDYYRMVAVFNPLQRSTRGRTELDLPIGTREELAQQVRRDRQLASLVRVAAHPWGSSFGTGMGLIGAIHGSLRQAIADLPRGYFLHEPSSPTPQTHLLIRGKASQPGPKVEPGVPAVLVPKQPEFSHSGIRTSGRRLTLARWIARPEHPLTARVIVNRVWQNHFGQGIVRTPSDFGVMGQRPTHPELLDWLASWFIEQGWSIKKLHRLILSSNTYRMSKHWNEEQGTKDPENHLFWRFPYQRLEVEAIRDSVLSVSGQLHSTMYGPSMYPEVPREALKGHSDPDKIWKPFDEREASRRTIYAHIKRSFVVPLLETLDLCDHARSSDRRLVTTVAPQALMLFNGAFVNRQARHLAERLVREVGDDPAQQIDRAFRLTLCRPPTEKEQKVLLGFRQLEEQSLRREEKLDEPTARKKALEQMCRVLFNLNEFVYPD